MNTNRYLTAMNVKRYWISPNGIACEDSEGKFVRYEDHAALEARCAALASLGAEAVAWIVHARTGDQLTTDGGYVANAEGILGLHSTPLYSAPTAPVAPDLKELEAVKHGRNPVLAYADSYRDMAKQGVESIPVWSVITDLERNIAPLFTTPLAPVVPEELPREHINGWPLAHSDYAEGWNDCRAAMLQGAAGNSPVIPDGWKLVPIDPTKDMLRAGQSVVGFWLNTVHCYSKMLSAAPAAPQQEV